MGDKFSPNSNAYLRKYFSCILQWNFTEGFFLVFFKTSFLLDLPRFTITNLFSRFLKPISKIILISLLYVIVPLGILNLLHKGDALIKEQGTL